MDRAAMTLGVADSGRTVEVRAGETIALELPENATTGYTWTFDGLDERIVTAHESGFARDSEAVGSGGVMRWSLRAVAPGTAQVRLKLWRRWEGDASVQRRYAVTVNVVR
jgi:inhibitor of cysteine peptidase